MKKIAIKGHPTRGKDIIKILEALGGVNEMNLNGSQPTVYYYLKDRKYIRCKPYSVIVNEYDCYTLEEYEQKFSNIMEKIAIKGNSYQSQKIIQILESLGGLNVRKYNGNDPGLYYYINDKHHIDCSTDLGLPKEYIIYTLQEYKQNHTMETKRNIQIDLTTAKEWYKQGGDLRKVALQAFTENELQSLPKSWKEYCEINPYLTKDKEFFLAPDGTITNIPHHCYRREDFVLAMSSKKRAEQFVVLSKLLQIRDYYNQGWTPNWVDSDEEKYAISTNRNELYTFTTWFTNYLFVFKTKELRDEFFTNFKMQLEKIKEFL